MTGLLARARFVVGAVAIAGLIAFAAPVRAQPQSAPVDPDASVVNEQTLLRQSPRIEGLIDQPDERARVLIQPAGRTWDHFHQVTLHWLGAIIIVGTVAGLAAAYFRPRTAPHLGGTIRTQGAALQGIRAVRALAHRGLVRRSRHFRAEHHLREAAAAAVDRAGRLQRVLASRQIRAQFHELSVRARPRADRRDLASRTTSPTRSTSSGSSRAAGFIASKHAPARRFNAGEKLVFWGALGAGAAVSVSGFLLLFPFYVTDIAGMQIAQVVHSVIAVLFVALDPRSHLYRHAWNGGRVRGHVDRRSRFQLGQGTSRSVARRAACERPVRQSIASCHRQPRPNEGNDCGQLSRHSFED